MKKYTTLILSLAVITGIFGLTACGSKSKTKPNEPTTNMEEARMEEDSTSGISDNLAHRAYDAIFSLSFATLSAGTDENGITVEVDGNNSTYHFENVTYLKDEPSATVSGYMKAINGETTDESDVSFTFTGDPEGLKTVTIKSSGLHGQTHDQGILTINGEERPFMEFVDYFGSKLNEQSPLEVQQTEE